MSDTYNQIGVRVSVNMRINGVGNRMKVARIMAGKGTRDVAETVGRSMSSIERYENGSVMFPPPNIIIAIAEFLDVSPYWLLSGVGKPCKEDQERSDCILQLLETMEGRVDPVVKAYQHTK